MVMEEVGFTQNGIRMLHIIFHYRGNKGMLHIIFHYISYFTSIVMSLHRGKEKILKEKD